MDSQQRTFPLSTTIGEIASRIDVPSRDVLDAAIAAGVQPFWHEGQQFRDPAYLKTYLRIQPFSDPSAELEFHMTLEASERLADELGVPVGDLLDGQDAIVGANQKGPRKFIASESRLTDEPMGKRNEHAG
jgi:hypothetical protein